jgi:hypothetical protein
MPNEVRERRRKEGRKEERKEGVRLNSFEK